MRQARRFPKKGDEALTALAPGPRDCRLIYTRYTGTLNLQIDGQIKSFMRLWKKAQVKGIDWHLRSSLVKLWIRPLYTRWQGSLDGGERGGRGKHPPPLCWWCSKIYAALSTKSADLRSRREPSGFKWAVMIHQCPGYDQIKSIWPRVGSVRDWRRLRCWKMMRPWSCLGTGSSWLRGLYHGWRRSLRRLLFLNEAQDFQNWSACNTTRLGNVWVVQQNGIMDIRLLQTRKLIRKALSANVLSCGELEDYFSSESILVLKNIARHIKNTWWELVEWK